MCVESLFVYDKNGLWDLVHDEVLSFLLQRSTIMISFMGALFILLIYLQSKICDTALFDCQGISGMLQK